MLKQIKKFFVLFFQLKVNGAWGSWALAVACSASCGENGVETYTRTCIGQANGGSPCVGSPSELRPCNRVRCPGKVTFENFEISFKI